MAEPPLFVGAVQVRVTVVSPGVLARLVGRPGTDATITELLDVEYSLWPRGLIAVIRKIYVVPLDNPVTVAEVFVETPSAKVHQVHPLFDE